MIIAKKTPEAGKRDKEYTVGGFQFLIAWSEKSSLRGDTRIKTRRSLNRPGDLAKHYCSQKEWQVQRP